MRKIGVVVPDFRECVPTIVPCIPRMIYFVCWKDGSDRMLILEFIRIIVAFIKVMKQWTRSSPFWSCSGGHKSVILQSTFVLWTWRKFITMFPEVFCKGVLQKCGVPRDILSLYNLTRSCVRILALATNQKK